jgi:DNA-binding MarR family transcriptional regulator
MIFNININQPKAIELGLNLNQTIVFSMLTTASTWAKPVILNKKLFYWVSRNKVIEEIPLLPMKPDTVQRHFKALQKLGVINYLFNKKRDLISITPKGKKYLMMESNTMSEMNPKKLGNESEFNSEMNPTYNNTNTNHRERALSQEKAHNTSYDYTKEVCCKDVPKTKPETVEDIVCRG